MSLNNVKDKCIDGFYKVKSYWHKAPTGYEVSYKEVTNFTVGFGSIGIASVLVQWTSLAVTMPLMLSYFKASSGIIFILTMVAALIGLMRAPILSMIIDNSNSNNGKFKPFLIWSCTICCICFMVIPFIPQAWNSINIFSFTMPAIPLFGITETSAISMSVGLLLMFILMQVGTFIHTLFVQCMTGIENTITSVAQERSNITAIKNLISNLPNSLVNILMPAFAAILFTDGMKDVRIYRIFFPIVAIIAVVCAVVMYKGTNERMVINKRHKNKVKFWQGAKELSKNKYFWIITAFTVLSGIRGGANIYLYICNYSIGGKLGSTILAICNMVLNNAFIPGLLLGPMLVKKFGKAKVLNTSNILFVTMVVLQLVFIQAGNAGSFLILFGIFFQNLAGSVSFVSAIMTSDVLDYQQYKTNKRQEGFWHNYSNFILTFVGIFTAILTPLFLSFAGIGFGEVLDDVLQDVVIREKAYMNLTYLALIGGVLCIIPMMFYDLTEYKHRNIVRALRVRKAIENYQDGVLEDYDLICLKEVLDYLVHLKEFEGRTDLSKKEIKELKSAHYITEEMEKYDASEIEEMMTKYDEAKERYDDMLEQDRLANLKRNIELEEKILAFKTNNAAKKVVSNNAKMEKKSAKNGTDYTPEVFDEEAYVAEQIAKSRFMKDKDQLAKLRSTEIQEITEDVVEVQNEETEVSDDEISKSSDDDKE